LQIENGINKPKHLIYKMFSSILAVLFLIQFLNIHFH